MEGSKYQWGDKVRVMNDIWNDGSYPEVDANEVLVLQGAQGYVLQVGKDEGGKFLYVVEFGDKLVGCFEEELSKTQDVSHEGTKALS